MISLVAGLPGEGKSLTTSMQIREDLDRGINVYTSLHLNETRPNYHYFEVKDWEVILGLQDGIVYMEEAQFILDARQWAVLPVEFRVLLQKGRHEGLDFVIITQHIMQIDVSARRLIMQARTVKKLLSIKKWNFGIFVSFDANILGDNEVQIESIFPDIKFATKADWEYYNSYALRSIKPPPIKQECACGRMHRIDKDHLDTPVQITALHEPQPIHRIVVTHDSTPVEDREKDTLSLIRQ